MNRLTADILRAGMWCLIVGVLFGCSKHGPPPGGADDEPEPVGAAASPPAGPESAGESPAADEGLSPARSQVDADTVALIESCEVRVNAHCDQARSLRAEAEFFADGAEKIGRYHQSLRDGLPRLSSLIQAGGPVEANRRTYSVEDLKQLRSRVEGLLKDQALAVERCEADSVRQSQLAEQAGSRCADGRRAFAKAKSRQRGIESQEILLLAMESPDDSGIDEQARREFQAPLAKALAAAREEMQLALVALVAVEEPRRIAPLDRAAAEQAVKRAGRLAMEVSMVLGE